MVKRIFSKRDSGTSKGTRKTFEEKEKEITKEFQEALRGLRFAFY